MCVGGADEAEAVIVWITVRIEVGAGKSLLHTALRSVIVSRLIAVPALPARLPISWGYFSRVCAIFWFYFIELAFWHALRKWFHCLSGAHYFLFAKITIRVNTPLFDNLPRSPTTRDVGGCRFLADLLATWFGLAGDDRTSIGIHEQVPQMSYRRIVRGYWNTAFLFRDFLTIAIITVIRREILVFFGVTMFGINLD
jgi:hypothetical protein